MSVLKSNTMHVFRVWVGFFCLCIMLCVYVCSCIRRACPFAKSLFISRGHVVNIPLLSGLYGSPSGEPAPIWSPSTFSQLHTRRALIVHALSLYVTWMKCFVIHQNRPYYSTRSYSRIGYGMSTFHDPFRFQMGCDLASTSIIRSPEMWNMLTDHEVWRVAERLPQAAPRLHSLLKPSLKLNMLKNNWI